MKGNEQEGEDLQGDGLAKTQVKTFSVFERNGKGTSQQKNQRKLCF